VDSGDGLSIRVESHRRAVESQIRQITIWNWLTGSNCRTGCWIDRRVTSRNIERSAAGTEVAQSFRAGRQTPFYGSRILTDAFVFLAYKKEKLVFLDRSVEVPPKIVESQFRFYRREEITRVEG